MTIALGTLGCICTYLSFPIPSYTNRGLAVGYVDNITFPAVTLVIEPQDIGLATGVLGSLRALGGAVAQAVYVSVLNNEQAKNMPKYVGPAATAAGLPESSLPALLAALTAGTGVESVPGATDSVLAAATAALKIAYSESFRIVFYCTIPFSVLLIISSCFIPDMKNFLHYDVAKRLQDNTKDNTKGEFDNKPEVEMVENVERRA
jgi:hypothetical protein